MECRLKDFLASPQRPDGTLNYNELSGFLFAIACSPEMVIPSDWQPLIFDDEDPNYQDMDEAMEITEAIMTLYNQYNDQVVQGAVQLPDGCKLSDSPLDNLMEDAPVSQWSNGFLYGHSYLEELWNEYVPESLEDELGSCVMVLSFFSDPELAEAYYKESGQAAGSLEQMTQAVSDLFGEAMASYAHMGRSIYLGLLEYQEAEGELVGSEDVNYNDPCPCGSGKEFHACCGAKRTLH